MSARTASTLCVRTAHGHHYIQRNHRRAPRGPVCNDGLIKTQPNSTSPATTSPHPKTPIHIFPSASRTNHFPRTYPPPKHLSPIPSPPHTPYQLTTHLPLPPVISSTPPVGRLPSFLLLHTSGLRPPVQGYRPVTLIHITISGKNDAVQFLQDLLQSPKPVQ